MDHSYNDFAHLVGKHVQLWYKPSERSRKWRPSFINLSFGQTAYDYGHALAAQEQWHDWKFEECDPAKL